MTEPRWDEPRRRICDTARVKAFGEPGIDRCAAADGAAMWSRSTSAAMVGSGDTFADAGVLLW